ncbi:hypothetical protein HYU94_01735 [Candidatus Daviesbacteria bacterium]|nr:hypothetical protein [Candidatus Daviesbacteria bacterium]
MYKKAFLLFLITLVVYHLSSRGEGAHWNYFVLLADAFLHGRLDLLQNPLWLNELVNWQGRYYVVFPPMPAVLLVPFVYIFGTSFSQPFASVFFGSISAAISYLVFLNIFRDKKIAIWSSLLFAFGTIFWFHAEVGSAWYFAQIVANLFLWIMLLEVTTKKRLFLVGLFIGAAYLSRIPTILAAIFPVIYLHDKFFLFQNNKIRNINWQNISLYAFGLIAALFLNALYNYFRFGVVYDIAYQLLPVFNEPWYKYGLVSFYYIPVHLIEMFTALPRIVNYPPFMIPSMFAMAVWFTTPAFLLIAFARYKTKIIFASAVTAIAIAIPSLMHGGNGFTQFGYRHTLDYLPFLLILVISGMRENLKWWIKALIILSIVVNLWGVIMISFLSIWTM